MEKRSHQTAEVIALSLLFLAIAAFTLVGFARDWKPPVASVHGEGIDGVIRYLALTTGAVLVIGTTAFLVFLWRYGRGQNTPSPASNPKAERWWSLVPVLGMAVISEAGVIAKGLPVWHRIYEAPPPGALVVELTAQQFEWLVRYPGKDGVFGRTDPTLVESSGNPLGLVADDPTARDDLVFRNRLRLPVGRVVQVRLRSHDVLHSFTVPAFRVKQDVVPGVVQSVLITPNVLGTYEIICAELCGMAHYRMGGRVMVLEPAEFESWLDGQTGAPQ